MFHAHILDSIIIAGVLTAASAVIAKILKSVLGAIARRTPVNGKSGFRTRILRVLESRMISLCLVAGASLEIREIREGNAV